MDYLGMCERTGYEYHCGFWSDVFWSDNDVIPNKIIDVFRPHLEKKVYFFEIQTYFMLKRRLDDDDGDEYHLMGSEIYCVTMYESDGEDYLKNWMGHRLEAYWIPVDEIQNLVSDAFDYAKMCSVEDDAKLIIPVVVQLTVCTVQMEKESVDEVYDRAISPECLIPLYLSVLHSGISDMIDSDLVIFLRDLEKKRVEDVVEGFSLMEVCPICLRDPTIGAQISRLPSCGHAFHSRCIVPWLIKSNSCPLCRSQAHGFPVCTDLPKIITS